MERRIFTASETRVESREDGTKTISGRGAVYYRKDDPGTEYQLWDGVYERIMPGAFDGIGEADVRSLFNHDPNLVLGRTKSGTLELTTDSRGLRYTVNPPNTQLVRDQVLAPIERGDVSGASFMFFPREAAWVEEERDGRHVEIRELRSVEVVEVGPVTFPAYASTTAGVRAEGDLSEVKASLEAERRKRPSVAEAVAVQARWAEVQELEARKNY